jgi:enolase
MSIIKSVSFRKVLNSHVQFTNEFIIKFDDESIGIGGSPQGETISIYEDKKVTITPESIIQKIMEAGVVGQSLTQETFDAYLQGHIAEFGRNNSYALSEAYFNATRETTTLFEVFQRPDVKFQAPRLSLNILNGGWHAYTNPVLSDFSEFMLVAKGNDVAETITVHNEIQRIVKNRLAKQTKTIVSGNPVNCFATRDNREVFDFLLNICNELGVTNQFELMIDASAGDLWKDNTYRFEITDDSIYSSEEFVEYWMDIIRQYNLRFLEDPFREEDYPAWQKIMGAQESCYIVGDNFYSTNPDKIEEGASKKYANAVIVKPNQAGTVTAVRHAIEVAQRMGYFVITSHRSISTESVFLSTLSCLYGVDGIKIGPLESDYSSVVRLNEIIRLTEG